MTKPPELVEAELIHGLCREYRALPEPGGLLDQPVWLLQMHAILAESAGAAATPDPLAALADLMLDV